MLGAYSGWWVAGTAQVDERSCCLERRSDRYWVWLIAVSLGGYLVLGRSFAYLGILPLKLFIGELVLAGFFLTRTRHVLGRWLTTLLYPSTLTGFSMALAAFLFYGVFLLARGYAAGYPLLLAVQNFVFNYYPFYLFLGIWVGARRPELIRRFVVAVGLLHGLYGLALLAGLRRAVPIYIAKDVPLFGQPAGAAALLVGLLCYPAASRAYQGVLLAMNLLVLIGTQVRAEWLGFLVAFGLWTVLMRKSRILWGVIAVTVLLSLIGALSDLRLPGMEDRGGDVTVKSLVGRVVAPVDRELAEQIAGRGILATAGTYEWRKQWWRSIWSEIHRGEPAVMVFGPGYGYPLHRLHEDLGNAVLRTPHNVFFYALGYGGWVGVLLFYVLQAQLGALMLKVYRFSGQPLGLLLWVMVLAEAHFGNWFESPFGAIPTYLLLGMCAAPLVKMEGDEVARFSWA